MKRLLYKPVSGSRMDCLSRRSLSCMLAIDSDKYSERMTAISFKSDITFCSLCICVDCLLLKWSRPRTSLFAISGRHTYAVDGGCFKCGHRGPTLTFSTI